MENPETKIELTAPVSEPVASGDAKGTEAAAPLQGVALNKTEFWINRAIQATQVIVNVAGIVTAILIVREFNSQGKADKIRSAVIGVLSQGGPHTRESLCSQGVCRELGVDVSDIDSCIGRLASEGLIVPDNDGNGKPVFVLASLNLQKKMSENSERMAGALVNTGQAMQDLLENYDKTVEFQRSYLESAKKTEDFQEAMLKHQAQLLAKMNEDVFADSKSEEEELKKVMKWAREIAKAEGRNIHSLHEFEQKMKNEFPELDPTDAVAMVLDLVGSEIISFCPEEQRFFACYTPEDEAHSYLHRKLPNTRAFVVELESTGLKSRSDVEELLMSGRFSSPLSGTIAFLEPGRVIDALIVLGYISETDGMLTFEKPADPRVLSLFARNKVIQTEN